MKTILLTSVLALTFAGAAVAGPKCTDEDRSMWMSQDQMKKQIEEQGYRIKKFKETSGSCYEIYGYDNKDRRVEIYFHPVTGDAVNEPYRVCRRVNILRDYPDDKIKIYP